MIETNGKTELVVNGKAVARPMIMGRYIVADPRICHGKPTFRGTRIFVADVLEQVSEGLDWESIAPAVDLARRSFLNHFAEFKIEPLPA